MYAVEGVLLVLDDVFGFLEERWAPGWAREDKILILLLKLKQPMARFGKTIPKLEVLF